MSSRTLLSTLAPALMGFACLVSAADAAVRCPPSSGGHPLRALGGGSLYLGRIEDNMVQAPDGTKQGPGGWVNTWTFRSARGMTLVCRYEGMQAAVALPLDPGTKSCRQDARSFACE